MASDTIEPERGDRARTAEYFGRLADTYGDGAYYGARRAAVMRAIASELNVAREVLDLGCGNGEYLREFARAPVSMLVGADLTFEMAATARVRVPLARVVRADASVLPFQDARFDVVFCSHVLQFVGDDLDLTLDEITRCLRPGGALIATLPGDSVVRREIESLLGAERYAEFAQLVFRRRARRNRAGREERFRTAFERSKLAFTKREAPFKISWPDIVEWIRIRWIPVVPESDRGPIEPMLAEISATARERTFSMLESLAIGRKN